MANLSKNITNTVNVFGLGPPTRWGESFGQGYTMTFGTAKWGEGLPVITLKIFNVIITNSVGTTFNYYRSDVRKFITNTVQVDSENARENLKDGSGQWSYVFPSTTTNAEQRAFASWTVATDPAASFTCMAAASTTSWT